MPKCPFNDVQTMSHAVPGESQGMLGEEERAAVTLPKMNCRDTNKKQWEAHTRREHITRNLFRPTTVIPGALKLRG